MHIIYYILYKCILYILYKSCCKKEKNKTLCKGPVKSTSWLPLPSPYRQDTTPYLSTENSAQNQEKCMNRL